MTHFKFDNFKTIIERYKKHLLTRQQFIAEWSAEQMRQANMIDMYGLAC